MNLAVIALILFFAMKLIYSNWADYTSHYWAVVYYSCLYFMLASVMRYIGLMAITKLQRLLFYFAALYFTVLLLVHLACFIDIQLYTKLIVDVGRVSTGVIILIFGLIFINYKRLRE